MVWFGGSSAIKGYVKEKELRLRLETYHFDKFHMRAYKMSGVVFDSRCPMARILATKALEFNSRKIPIINLKNALLECWKFIILSLVTSLQD